ncbi:MAG: TIGR04219 family outer membrane beta-barrel protein [Deltaproteobacteria bacterium]
MKKMFIFALYLLGLSLIAVPCPSFAWGLEVGVGGAMQMQSGEIGYEPVSPTDSVDLGTNTKYQPYGRLKAVLPLFLPNIYVMATPMNFDGSGNKTFKFGDYTFTGAYESKLKLDHYDLALYYSLPFLKTATLDVLNIELGINVRVIDFKAEVREVSTGNSVSESLVIPVPMAYVGVQVKPIKAISLEAEGRGIAYSSNHYFDVIGRAKVTVFGPLFVAAGYRYEKVKIDQSDVRADVQSNGPFVEVGLSF